MTELNKHLGFKLYPRKDAPKRAVKERVGDYNEIEELLSLDELKQQAIRCMDCGIPTCHAYGCPLANRIPDWNDMVYRGQWKRALDLLHATDNFPEVTGRICPAPCEPACTVSIHDKAVSIRHIELQIVEEGWKQGWIVPQKPAFKTGKRVAVVGSGPAGLAAAQQLVRSGHEVVIFEKSDRIGGLLRYGVPDFKLGKHVIDRRIEQMKGEGIKFEVSVDAGVDLSPRFMMRSFDAVLMAVGAGVPRELDIDGRNLKGVHLAMEFLTQQNRRIMGDEIQQTIDAGDKNVVVLGGGDTGSDCVGTSLRQKAKSVTQIEILPQPPSDRLPDNPWPTWPLILMTSTSQEEGCRRLWGIKTVAIEGQNGHAKSLTCVKLEWNCGKAGDFSYKIIPGSEIEIKADLILLSMGFLHGHFGPFHDHFQLEKDSRNNVIVNDLNMTSTRGVFAAGDCVTGASLVVRAIAQGRAAAEGVNQYLQTG